MPTRYGFFMYSGCVEVLCVKGFWVGALWPKGRPRISTVKLKCGLVKGVVVVTDADAAPIGGAACIVYGG